MSKPGRVRTAHFFSCYDGAINIHQRNTMNAEELANVTLEHLRHIRARVDKIADDVDDIKLRMSNLESSMASVRREVLQGDETDT